MTGLPRARRLRYYAIRLGGLLCLAVGLCALTLSLVHWATGRTDLATSDWLRRSIANELDQVQAQILHEQASITPWDDAYAAVARPENTDWLDNNLLEWPHDYFDYQEVFLLAPGPRLIRGWSDAGAVLAPLSAARRALLAPFAARLRARPADDFAAGLTEIALLEGAPVVISLRPILPESRDVLPSDRDDAVLHVAIYNLARDFLPKIEASRPGVTTRILPAGAPHGPAALPLQNANGQALAYVTWNAPRPGDRVFHDILPILLGFMAAGLILVGVAGWLILRARQRERADMARIETMARHDSLTGLWNRSGFASSVDALLRAAPEQEVAMLYIDLDRFKLANDTYGHHVGDELLRQVSRRLTQTAPGARIARLGGDEFIIFLPDASDPQAVAQQGEQLLRALQPAFEVKGHSLRLGASLGYACDRAAIGREELVRRADAALYAAKAGGRNRAEPYDPRLDREISFRKRLEQDLRAALEAGGEGLELYFQPVYATRDRSLVSVEGLIRWTHERRGRLPPSLFVPLAEESDLIVELGRYVLREGCRAARRWPGVRIALNVSVRELNQPGYADGVRAVLAETGLEPHRLELEITETLLAESQDPSFQTLHELRALGVSLALDDFGVGFSNFVRLRAMKVDRIKIDRSFVSGLLLRPEDLAVVRSMIELARAFGLQSTAEGVETEDQARILTELGCTDMQGFLFCAPQPAGDPFPAQAPNRSRT
ncbi:EAL domain-containing protein [Pseudooceanicola sp. CBS1P-1]|uniref:putative bifunctional diguanylate cyclase/phosphodiesterase n=1 Tax=Pseudooceanicola TaxID=1679449 RepID=UPI0013717A34|nr:MULTISPECIES: EAL domain-containing protein [Pseudooceanicola]MBT9384305.1 EAL domain-containing protein [Pseudooceanicola endophyticus]